MLPTHKAWLLKAINVLLFALLAWTVAGLVWRIFAPAPTEPTSAPSPVTSTGAPASSRIDIATIVPLFGMGGDGKEGATANSSLPYKLRGVIAAGKSRSAAATFSGVGPKDSAFRVGDEMQPGVRLAEVNADHAIVDNNGRRERIELDAKPAAKLDSRPTAGATSELIKAAGAAAGATVMQQILPISMPRARLISAMQGGNVAEWATGLRADPRKGIRIEAGSARGLVQTLELHEGDVLQRINGRPLSHPGDIALVYNEFSQKNKIQLEVLRDDRALTLDYTLQP